MGRTGLHNGFLFLFPSLALCLFLYTSPALAQITFNPPALLNTDGTTDTGQDRNPDIATDGMGNWISVWHTFEAVSGSDTDIFFSRSTDAGASWTAPALLNTNGMTDIGNDVYPSVSTDRVGNWVTVWHSSDSLSGTVGTDRDIFISRSTDAGTSWTAPALLNANGTTDTTADTDAVVATDGMGTGLSLGIPTILWAVQRV